MTLKQLLRGSALAGALLLPLALSAQDPVQDRVAVRQGRRQVRTDRKAALAAPVGQKAPDRQAARAQRQTVRPQRRELRQDRRQIVQGR